MKHDEKIRTKTDPNTHLRFPSCASGPGGEGAAETDVHAGHVRQEEGQSEEASSQTDPAGAAGRPQTRSLHQVPSQFAGSVCTPEPGPCVHTAQNTLYSLHNPTGMYNVCSW